VAYLNSLGNIIRSVSPANGTSDVSVDTSIVVTFTFDMEKDSLGSNIVLLDESSNRIPTVVTYDTPEGTPSAKVATVKPLVRLDPSTRYKVIINGGTRGINSMTGTMLGTDWNMNFVTAAVAPPDKAYLVSPADRSVLTGLAEFSWNSVAGISEYEFQISVENTFGTTLYSSIVTGTSVIPDVALNHDSIYYWRVRAISNSTNPLTGPWSDLRQFRYVVSAPFGIPGTTPTTPNVPSVPVDILEVIPGPEELFVPNLTSITVKFTDNIDESTVIPQNFIVKVDYLEGLGEPTTAIGYYEVIDNVVQFHFGNLPDAATPISSITEVTYDKNTVITVELRKEISSISGSQLSDDVTWIFATPFSPYYSKISEVRQVTGDVALMATDLEIAKLIHRVSLWADQIAAQPYGSINSEYLGEIQSQTYNNIFFHDYVKYETALRLLHTKTLENTKRQAGTRQIGDLLIKDPMNLSSDYRMMIERLEALRNRAQFYLTMGRNTYPLPKSAVKGEKLYPYPLNKRNSF
jgi:hypothetical protein